MSYSPPVYFPSLVFLSVTQLSCFYVSFCPLLSFRISFECFCFVFFLLVPPLSHFCVFFSPGSHVRLKREKHGEKKTISFCLPFGDPCENALCAKSLFILFFGGFLLSTAHVLFDILGICFERVRDSLLLLICCYIVLLVFGEEPSFGPTCLFSYLDSFCFVFVFCLFWVLLLLWSFAEVCFFVLLIFLILGCCFFATLWSCWLLTSCLGCVFLRVGFGAFILW